MANDSPVTVVPQLQFLSEKPTRRSTSKSKSNSIGTSSIHRALRGATTITTATVDEATTPTATATEKVVPTATAIDKATSTESAVATAVDKIVANIGTTAEADPLSHAIRVLLYR